MADRSNHPRNSSSPGGKNGESNENGGRPAAPPVPATSPASAAVSGLGRGTSPAGLSALGGIGISGRGGLVPIPGFPHAETGDGEGTPSENENGAGSASYAVSSRGRGSGSGRGSGRGRGAANVGRRSVLGKRGTETRNAPEGIVIPGPGGMPFQLPPGMTAERFYQLQGQAQSTSSSAASSSSSGSGSGPSLSAVNALRFAVADPRAAATVARGALQRQQLAQLQGTDSISQAQAFLRIKWVRPPLVEQTLRDTELGPISRKVEKFGVNKHAAAQIMCRTFIDYIIIYSNESQQEGVKRKSLEIFLKNLYIYLVYNIVYQYEKQELIKRARPRGYFSHAESETELSEEASYPGYLSAIYNWLFRVKTADPVNLNTQKALLDSINAILRDIEDIEFPIHARPGVRENALIPIIQVSDPMTGILREPTESEILAMYRDIQTGLLGSPLVPGTATTRTITDIMKAAPDYRATVGTSSKTNLTRYIESIGGLDRLSDSTEAEAMEVLRTVGVIFQASPITEALIEDLRTIGGRASSAAEGVRASLGYGRSSSSLQLGTLGSSAAGPESGTTLSSSSMAAPRGMSMVGLPVPGTARFAGALNNATLRRRQQRQEAAAALTSMRSGPMGTGTSSSSSPLVGVVASSELEGLLQPIRALLVGYPDADARLAKIQTDAKELAGGRGGVAALGEPFTSANRKVWDNLVNYYRGHPAEELDGGRRLQSRRLQSRKQKKQNKTIKRKSSKSKKTRKH